MQNSYAASMSEVLYYLKGIRKTDLEKIPEKFLNFLRDNCDPNYVCKFDYNKPLSELKLLDETRGIIALICVSYLCQTDDQKRQVLNNMKENEKRFVEEQRIKYNVDIFKKEEKIEPKNIENETQNLPAEIKKETIFEKILNHIKRIFKRG